MNTQNNNKVEQMIDLLQSHIRNGYSVPELIKQQTRLVNTERQLNSNEESKTDSKNIDFDIDLELPGSDGFNCLHVACGSGHIEMVKYLLNIRFRSCVFNFSIGVWTPIPKGKKDGPRLR